MHGGVIRGQFEKDRAQGFSVELSNEALSLSREVVLAMGSIVGSVLPPPSRRRR